MSKSAQRKELWAVQISETTQDGQSQTNATFVIAEVAYYKDRMRNTRTGEVFPRGYRVNVDIRDRGHSSTGFSFESFMLFQSINVRRHLEEAKMFSAKKLEAFAIDPTVLQLAEELKAEALALHQAQQKEEESHAH
ncbi:MAG: hypothetical protein OEY86_07520 [Nitrospira sp.]|nr:hypothetical protein [Nitrospira sp.]